MKASLMVFAQRWVVAAALLGAVLPMSGCGKGNPAVASLARDKAANRPNGPIPSGNSMYAAAPGAIGTFQFTGSYCRTSSGIPVPRAGVSDDWTDTLEISDHTIKDTTVYTNGCTVTSTFTVVGVDSTRLVIGGRNSTYIGSCSDKPNSDGNLYFYYEVNGSDFSLIYDPVDGCESDERTQDTFSRVY